MKRRQFAQRIAALSTISLSNMAFDSSPAKRKLKAPRLNRGDTVGLITPGSYITDEALEKAISNIETLGFRIRLGKNIRAERGFTAGTDQERLDDLHAMFQDADIKGVWCARGGYGCSRLLPKINYKLIKKNPKVLIGYSDITALLQAIYLQTGLIGFHGPVGASDMTDYTQAQLLPLIVEGKARHHILISPENEQHENPLYHTKIFREGLASGELVGGNLSLLSAMAGTPYAMDAKDKIVFIEDIGEKPYRIDRMLTQLRQSSNLHKAKAIALGVFAGCEKDEDARSLSLEETLRDRLMDLDMPIIYGLSFGHISNMCTLPIGAKATLDTRSKTLALEEAVVQ